MHKQTDHRRGSRKNYTVTLFRGSREERAAANCELFSLNDVCPVVLDPVAVDDEKCSLNLGAKSCSDAEISSRYLP